MWILWIAAALDKLTAGSKAPGATARLVVDRYRAACLLPAMMCSQGMNWSRVIESLKAAERALRHEPGNLGQPETSTTEPPPVW